MSKYKVGDYVELKKDAWGLDSKFGWLIYHHGDSDFGFFVNEKFNTHDTHYMFENFFHKYGLINEDDILCLVEEPKEECVDLDIALTDSERFKLIQDVNYTTYKEKNEKYGDSFSKSVQKYGMIAALTRMSDKWNRIENMILNGIEDNEESLIDSIDDLSNYLIMTHIELEKGNKK